MRSFIPGVVGAIFALASTTTAAAAPSPAHSAS